MNDINDLASLRNFFKTNVKNPIVGVGVHAFNRLGLEDVISNYRIIALRYSLDAGLIENDIDLLSLEKDMGTKHIDQPRNSTTVAAHPKTYEFLKKLTEQYGCPPVMLSYKSSTNMEEVCNNNFWILALPPTKFGKQMFENKITFRRILEFLNVPVPPGIIAKIENLSFKQLSESYGLPFVIQHPTRGGGKGTFFISNRDDFEKAIENILHKVNDEGEQIEDKAKEVIVMKFITGASPSITGCVTKYGILSTSPQHQLLDIPELYNPQKGSGLFCGHDWSSSNFSEDVKKQAYDIIEKVGLHFKDKGYKGIFGIDFILDEASQKLYAIEANPRMLGSFPTLTMSQLLNNETPILAFHLLEYLNVPYNINVEEINNLMRQNKKGAHMFLHNLTESWAKNYAAMKPGVYILKNKKPEFVRSGYKLQHIKSENEFLITEGVPMAKSHFSPNRRICRILTLAPIMEKHNRLNPWAKEITETVYRSFKMKPIMMLGLRRLVNPKALAKG